jgi:hypothetical protein
MARKLNRLAARLQTLFGKTAEEVAAETGFIQRKRKLTATAWLQTLVFGWAVNKRATVEDLADDLLDHGVEISPQGLAQRFTPQAAAFLRAILEKALTFVFGSTPSALPLLERFSGVYADDSSTVSLPAELASEFPGCGGDCPTAGQAAIKTFLRFEVCTGRFDMMRFSPGRVPDVVGGQQAGPPPAGSLHLCDLGFFDSDRLAEEDRQGVWWISRVPPKMKFALESGVSQPLSAFLKNQKRRRVDQWVLLGEKELKTRLVAIRCPKLVADKRKERLRRTAAKKQRRVSSEQLILCEWTVLITNLPSTWINLAELWMLYRVRWQIELVFKRWKSQGGLAQSAGRCGWRWLCEFYAKLLGQVVQNWLTLLKGGPLSGYSPVKLQRRVQRSLPGIATALRRSTKRLWKALQAAVDRLARLRPQIVRRKRPSTRQTLLQPDCCALN